MVLFCDYICESIFCICECECVRARVFCIYDAACVIVNRHIAMCGLRSYIHLWFTVIQPYVIVTNGGG